MTAMSDPHLGWATSFAYHKICMRHLASNFMTRFKDKLLKKLVCRAALATTQHKFNKHMTTIGRINFEAQQLLEVIPLELWALSHDGGRRYRIMTTNMFEVFNIILKGARNLPITTLVQLTFFYLNSYFVARREQGANRLASDEQYTPYVDAQIKARVLRLDQWRFFFKITHINDFMSSKEVVECSTSTYMTRNAHMVRH